MMEVKDFRNNLVHFEPFIEPKLQPRKAQEIIEKAISCLEPLIEKWAENEENITRFLKKARARAKPPEPLIALETVKEKKQFEPK